MTSTTALRSGSRRIVFAGLAVAFLLLSSSCEKKAAPPASELMQGRRPLAYSTFNETAHGQAKSTSAFATAMLGGGVEGGYDKYPPDSSPASPGQPNALDARKIVRNGALDLLVNDVGQSIEKIGSIVKGAGGFVEKSTQSNSGSRSASVTVRIPAARLDSVITQVKTLAISVDREGVEARDVTREYIDLDARLRNAQAEEAQYLQILKRATTIKDTLEVTEKLSDVRGQIEQMQGEMKFLTSQIDLSTLEISLRAEADETVAGIRWRPLRQAKVAVNEMVSGLTDWVDSVVAFIINLPLIAVWLFSVVFLLVVAVRLFRFLWRRFGPKTTWRLPWRRSTPNSEQKSG
ncbi:MAG: DUF4349 domain-containing protein [Candidatus Sulfotelmatobacter sp.]